AGVKIHFTSAAVAVKTTGPGVPDVEIGVILATAASLSRIFIFVYLVSGLGGAKMDRTSQRSLFPNKESFNRTDPTNFTESTQLFGLSSTNFRIGHTDQTKSIRTKEHRFTRSGRGANKLQEGRVMV